MSSLPPPAPPDAGAVQVYAGTKQASRLERRLVVGTFVREGLFSGVMINLVTGVLLIKFALLLEASPFVIGLLAAIPFFALFMQIPAVLVLARFPYRKRVGLWGSVLYRLALGAMAFIPFIEDKHTALYTLIWVVFIRELGLGWATGPWYSWVNALVNERVMGRAYGARLKIYTVAGTLVAVGAGFALDSVATYQADKTNILFSVFFFGAFISSLLSFRLLLKLPERVLPHQSIKMMGQQMFEPFKDVNFRRLLVFMLALLFAVNIAVPFFPYYMFTSLDISASYVVVLWAVMQLMQVPFFKWWGWVGDKFSHVTALSASLPFFVVSLLLWPFVALPETHNFTGVLLFVLHLLMGVGLAGVTLATQIIVMKLAPKELMTGYTAAMSLVAAFASGLGALAGGAVATYLNPISMQFKVVWQYKEAIVQTFAEATPVVVTGFEFLFLFAAFLTGLVTPLLSRVTVKGRVSDEMVFRLMGIRAMSVLRNSVSGPGARGLVYMPLSMIFRRLKKPKKETFSAPDS